MPLRQIFPIYHKAQSDETVLDIITVHGLDFVDTSGRCLASSWREPQDRPGRVWVQAFLQEHGIRARLSCYEYDSVGTFCIRPAYVSKEADCLLQQVHNSRIGVTQSRPIIFLAQGLGGILVKQALINAQSIERYADIGSATFGIVFFGTPHQQKQQRLSRILQGLTLPFLPRRGMAKAPYNTNIIVRINQAFQKQVESYLYISFYSEIDQTVPFQPTVMNIASQEMQVPLTSLQETLCCFPVGSVCYEKVTQALSHLCSLAVENHT